MSNKSIDLDHPGKDKPDDCFGTNTIVSVI
jgi:hypothetical protein